MMEDPATQGIVAKKKKTSCFMRVFGSFIGSSSSQEGNDTREDDCEKNNANTSCRPSWSLEKEKKLLEELTELTMSAPPDDTNSRNTILHTACEQHCSDDLIIYLLIKNDPKLVFVENAHNELPLHSAMRDVTQGGQGVSERVLQTLLSLNQDAVKHFNSSQCLPIHIACQFAVNEFVIKTLLGVYPQSVMTQCKLGLPYNVAGRQDDSIDVSSSDDEYNNGADDDDDDNDDDNKDLRQSLFVQFWNIFLNPVGPKHEYKQSQINYDSDIDTHLETDYSPLHLAILHNASPNIIDHILNVNPYCLNLKTSKGRTAMDIAKQRENSQDSITIMKSYRTNVKQILHLDAFSKSLLNLSIEEDRDKKKSLRAKRMWRKAGNAIIFANRLKISLGPKVDIDNDDSMKVSDNFVLPPSLERLCVDVILPVGFHQLRWALLNHQSSFNQDFHESSMGYSE